MSPEAITAVEAIKDISKRIRAAFGGDVGDFKACWMYLEMSDSTLRQLVWGKRIPFYKVGNQYRFRASALAKWIHDQEVDATRWATKRKKASSK